MREDKFTTCCDVFGADRLVPRHHERIVRLEGYEPTTNLCRDELSSRTRVGV